MSTSRTLHAAPYDLCILMCFPSRYLVQRYKISKNLFLSEINVQIHIHFQESTISNAGSCLKQ